MKKNLKKLHKIAFLVFLFFTSCFSPGYNDAIRKAEEQVGLGNFEKAVSIYSDLVQKFPKEPRNTAIFLQLGDLYASSIGDVKKGLDAYQKCIETAPTSEAARLAHERRAAIFENEGHAAGQVEEYTALLKYFGDHPDALKYRMGLGEAYITSREFQQARTELRGFVEKVQVSADLRARALFDIGETYFLEEKPGKAVRFYYALVQEAPKSQLVPEAKLRIATCLEEMGYLGLAQKFAEDAKKTYPNPDVVDSRIEGIVKRGKAPAIKSSKQEIRKSKQTQNSKSQ